MTILLLVYSTQQVRACEIPVELQRESNTYFLSPSCGSVFVVSAAI